MDPVSECASHGWSIVTSASANSQFAGALAGFVFTGIVVLFAMRGPRYTHTLAVLSPTFVILGFDSYLFSHVTGSAGDRTCARVWTDGMFASGMLGVGAAGVVTGACWLLAAHLDIPNEPHAGHEDETLRSLRRRDDSIDLPWLAAFMVYGVTVAIVLVLAMTADRYLRIVTRDDNSPWLLAIWSVPVVVLLTTIALGVIRRRRGRNRAWQKSDSRAFWHRSLRFVVYGMLGYAVFTPAVAGLYASADDSWWEKPSPLMIVPTIAIELVIATVLLVALVLAAPPMSAPQSPTAAAPSSDASRDVPAQWSGELHDQPSESFDQPHLPIAGPQPEHIEGRMHAPDLDTEQ
ncbi:hypothetical protein [Micromonospora rubida]